MNQTSFSSLVVPVLPAIGLPTSRTHRRGAALDHAFHHRGDLIGGHRIEHLLAPVDQRRLGLVAPLVGVAAAAFALVVLVDGVAVAVLDAVDQRRLDALAAIGEHRIGRRPCAAPSSRRRRARRTDRAAGRHRRRSAWHIRRSAACRRPAPAAPSSTLRDMLDAEAQRLRAVIFAGRIVFRPPHAACPGPDRFRSARPSPRVEGV